MAFRRFSLRRKFSPLKALWVVILVAFFASLVVIFLAVQRIIREGQRLSHDNHKNAKWQGVRVPCNRRAQKPHGANDERNAEPEKGTWPNTIHADKMPKKHNSAIKLTKEKAKSPINKEVKRKVGKKLSKKHIKSTGKKNLRLKSKSKPKIRHLDKNDKVKSDWAGSLPEKKGHTSQPDSWPNDRARSKSGTKIIEKKKSIGKRKFKNKEKQKFQKPSEENNPLLKRNNDIKVKNFKKHGKNERKETKSHVEDIVPNAAQHFKNQKQGRYDDRIKRRYSSAPQNSRTNVRAFKRTSTPTRPLTPARAHSRSNDSAVVKDEKNYYRNFDRWMAYFRNKFKPYGVFKSEEYEPLSMREVEGGFSVVRFYNEVATGRKVAIKRIIQSKDLHLFFRSLELAIKEAHLMAQIFSNHVPYTSELIRLLKDDQNNAFMVMEYIPGKDLTDLLNEMRRRHVRRYTMSFSAGVIARVALALRHLHDMHIAYKDLKFENIVAEYSIDTDSQTGDSIYLLKNARLVDYGLSEVLSSKNNFKCKAINGTPTTLAPEVYNGGWHGTPADIWSLGVVMYMMISGDESPFDHDCKRLRCKDKHESTEMIRSNVLHKDVRISDDLFKSDAVDLLSRMLMRGPEVRITAAQIIEHEWFANNGISFKDLMEDEENFMAERDRLREIYNAKRRLSQPGVPRFGGENKENEMHVHAADPLTSKTQDSLSTFH